MSTIEPTHVSTGESSRLWLVVYAVLAVLGLLTYATTDLGPWATITGTLGVLFVLLGLRSVWHWLGSRSIERTPIGSLQGYDGPVEIEGSAMAAGDPITAPVTGTECIAYRVEVSRWSPTREDSD